MNEILSVLLGVKSNTVSKYIQKVWNDSKIPYTSGIILSAKECYSICPGKVVSVKKDEYTWAVSVLVNDNQVVRYVGLSQVYANENDYVYISDMIGIAKNNFRFEYCTREEGRWPVRISGVTFYKHNPEEIVTDKLVVNTSVDDSDWDEKMITSQSDIPESAEDMLSGNRGD